MEVEEDNIGLFNELYKKFIDTREIKRFQIL